MRTGRLFLAVCLLLLSMRTVLADPISAVRLETGVSGHIHPALCLSKKGTLVVVYCKSEYKPYLLTRSTDFGKTWSAPELFPATRESQVYPGSLTALADGRIVHAWNEWYTTDAKAKSRYVAWSVSSDEGLTWSEPKQLLKANDQKTDAKTGSVVRHPFVELSPRQWLFSLSDRTIVYNPETGEEQALGDGVNHGLTPIVRTPRGTLVSGKGLRSTDLGKTWQAIKPFPDLSSQGWRHEMLALNSGVLIASQIVGPGVGGERLEYVVSRDDGVTWNFESPVVLHNPGRPIGGRACPRTVDLSARLPGALGTVLFDTDAAQAGGGSGVFFHTWSLGAQAGKAATN